MTSSPCPPQRLSHPGPPSIRSRPSPAQTTSSPPRPRMTSSPPSADTREHIIEVAGALGGDHGDVDVGGRLDAAEADVGQAPVGFTQRHALGLGIPALGEIPQPLAAATADDGDLTPVMERVQELPH